MTKEKLYDIIRRVLISVAVAKDGLYEGVPNGHLYALFMAEVDLDQWLKIISTLKSAGLLTETNYLLKPTEKLMAQLTKETAQRRLMNLKSKNKSITDPDIRFAYLIEPAVRITNDAELYAAVFKNGRAVIRPFEGVSLKLMTPIALSPVEFQAQWQGD